MKNGFSFIELLVVVSIVSVLALTSSIIYSRFLLQNAVANTEDQLAGELRKAQLYAMSGKKGTNWGVNYTSFTIVLYKGNSYAARDTAFDETFTVNPNVSVSGMSDVNFAHATGIPSTTATVTISAQNTTKTLTVNSQGTVAK